MDHRMLTKCLDFEEIKQVVFNINAYSSTPYGFGAPFIILVGI